MMHYLIVPFRYSYSIEKITRTVNPICDPFSL